MENWWQADLSDKTRSGRPVTASDQLHQDGFEDFVDLVILQKNNYAASKIIDVDIFHFFYLIKISFPVHFLFKWRQNLSACPSKLITLGIYLPVTFMSVCQLPFPLHTKYLIPMTIQFTVYAIWHLSTRQCSYTFFLKDIFIWPENCLKQCSNPLQ